MSDEELIGYAAIHCRTERALFHREHVKRLFLLAKMPVGAAVLMLDGSAEWLTVHEDLMTPILDKIEAHRRSRA